MSPEQVGAFAPGRVNLIGEHTDYNEGLALPFAIAAGITVRATATATAAATATPTAAATATADLRIRARALDLGEEDEFALAEPPPAGGGARSCAASWRSWEVRAFRWWARSLRSAAISRWAPGSPPRPRWRWRCVWPCSPWPAPRTRTGPNSRGCARAWRAIGSARRPGCSTSWPRCTGHPETALLIDFQTLQVDPVPLTLEGGWRLVLLDSGERHANARLRL